MNWQYKKRYAKNSLLDPPPSLTLLYFLAFLLLLPSFPSFSSLLPPPSLTLPRGLHPPIGDELAVQNNMQRKKFPPGKTFRGISGYGFGGIYFFLFAPKISGYHFFFLTPQRTRIIFFLKELNFCDSENFRFCAKI
jgi:hypothetical protein